jgi:hypothetical protein
MPAITAKAAKRLPLTPHRGRNNLVVQPDLPIVNRAVISPATFWLTRERQYRVTRLTKSGKFEGFAGFLRLPKQKGRREAGLFRILIEAISIWRRPRRQS